MKRTILVFTLTLLLPIATTARASTAGGNVNTPGGNVTGESAAIKIYLDDTPTAAASSDPANVQIPTNATVVITSLLALLY